MMEAVCLKLRLDAITAVVQLRRAISSYQSIGMLSDGLPERLAAAPGSKRKTLKRRYKLPLSLG